MGYPAYRYLVFGILGAAYILVFFHRMAPAMLAVDMMRDLNAGGALIGIMSSAYFYPYALMQIPAGLLSDSLGPRRSVTFFFMIGAAGSIAFGLTTSAGLAIAARVLVGLGAAMVFVPTLKILTVWFEPAKFSHMSAIFIALGGVGAFTAATPLALLSDAAGWRASMILIGAITLVISLGIWLIVRDTPQEKNFHPEHATARQDASAGRITLMHGLGMVIKDLRFWPIAISFLLGATVFLSYNGLWGGPFLMQIYRMTKLQAGSVMSMFAFGLIIGSPVMSLISVKFIRSKKKIYVTSLFLSTCLFAPIAFYTGDFSATMLFTWSFFYSFIYSGLIVIGYTLIKEYFPIEIAGTATGLLNIFPFVGAAIGQPLMGWYLDARGSGGSYGVDAYSAAFKICLIIICAALLASFFIKESRPHGT